MFTFADSSGEIGNQALLYGANNSGKTNFLRAIEAMGSIVRFGLSCHLPFKLDSESANNPSVFEVLLLTESGDRIKYGIKVDRHSSITSEWLCKCESGDTTDTYINLFDLDRLETPALKEPNQKELFLTRSSTAESRFVRDFFDSIYIAFAANKRHLDGDVLGLVNGDPILKSRLSEMMRAIDLPIPDIDLRLPNSRGFDEAFGLLSLLLFAESKKIKLLAIDNFAESLHPLLASKLLRIAGAVPGLQLLVATHATRLMDESPPSAIWLVEKNARRSSEFVGIVEYKITSDRISSAYLNGMYGGVPSVGIFGN